MVSMPGVFMFGPIRLYREDLIYGGKTGKFECPKIYSLSAANY